MTEYQPRSQWIQQAVDEVQGHRHMRSEEIICKMIERCVAAGHNVQIEWPEHNGWFREACATESTGSSCTSLSVRVGEWHAPDDVEATLRATALMYNIVMDWTNNRKARAAAYAKGV